MLRSFQAMLDYSMRARDGEVGSLDDLYFDDSSTLIRYLVVDTGSWLPGRLVLLTPAAIGGVDAEERQVTTALTCKQVEESPPIDDAKPVSRQQEEALHTYFAWQPYWGSPPLAAGVLPGWGTMVGAEQAANENRLEEEVAAMERERGDPHLRSAREVLNYQVRASDGDIGSVADLLVDDGDWAIRLLVVDTGTWLPGRKVVIAPQSVRGVDWTERRVSVDLTRDRVRRSPDYDPSVTPDRTWMQRLLEYYGFSTR